MVSLQPRNKSSTKPITSPQSPHKEFELCPAGCISRNEIRLRAIANQSDLFVCEQFLGPLDISSCKCYELGGSL